MRALVCGAGGFIGGHLVSNLLLQGHNVKAVDISPFAEWFQRFDAAESIDQTDLRISGNCDAVIQDVDIVYNLAATVGGIGYINRNPALCTLSVLINANLLWSASRYDVRKFFFASSSCLYRKDLQQTLEVTPLKESDAHPANPDNAYGWEKLYGEVMCSNFSADFGIDAKVARFHNCYGPYGSWDDGREKSPAAICRKVAEAKLLDRDYVEIWGDGSQLRSYMHVNDCIHGINLICDSDLQEPINLGSSQCVSVNELTDIVESIAGVKLRRKYVLNETIGVVGRNSDNSKLIDKFGWEPSISLEDGLADTYEWIEQQVKNKLG